MTEEDVILRIDSLTYGPFGVGRSEGLTVFVPLTAPGDRAKVKIAERKAKHAVGELAELIEPSPSRRVPPCPYFGACGGCTWQHLDYSAQLGAKQKNLEDAMRRIGKLDGFELLPIVPSPGEFHYRGRIVLQVDRERRVGFFRASSHALIEIESCLIADPLLERCLPAAREWIRQLQTPLRQVEILRGDPDNEILLCGQATKPFSSADERASESFLRAHPEISGLTLFARDWRRSWGKEKISLTSPGGIRMTIDGETFSQVNRAANEHLCAQLLRWGEFDGRDRALELYAGSGNLTLRIAQRCGSIVAVEESRRAVENGHAGGILNNLKNIRWICSDAPDAARQLARAGETFSKIILDPPRAGAKGLEESLSRLGAEKIYYVSCDPPTLARDLAALKTYGYRPRRVQPFDFFPHTFHVETLAELARG